MNEIISLDSPPNTDEGSQRSIDGIIGIIHLISGPYLIVITSKLRVGNIHGHAIYKIQTTDFVPFVSSTSHLNESQVIVLVKEHIADYSFEII